MAATALNASRPRSYGNETVTSASHQFATVSRARSSSAVKSSNPYTNIGVSPQARLVAQSVHGSPREQLRVQ